MNENQNKITEADVEAMSRLLGTFDSMPELTDPITARAGRIALLERLKSGAEENIKPLMTVITTGRERLAAQGQDPNQYRPSTAVSQTFVRTKVTIEVIDLRLSLLRAGLDDEVMCTAALDLLRTGDIEGLRMLGAMAEAELDELGPEQMSDLEHTAALGTNLSLATLADTLMGAGIDVVEATQTLMVSPERGDL